MKTKIVIGVMSLFLAFGSYMLTSNLEIETVPDVLAATDTETTQITVSCTSGNVTFQMPTAFTVDIPAPTLNLSGLPTYIADGNVNITAGAVETDPGPAADFAQNSAGVGDGFVSIEMDFPRFKTAGLNCTTLTQVKNSISDNDTGDPNLLDIDVGGTSETDYDNSGKIDGSTSYVVVHGSSGESKVTNCQDDGGSNERTGAAIDGEVQGGGEGTASAQCGGRYLMKYDNTNNTTNGVETVRWKTDPS